MYEAGRTRFVYQWWKRAPDGKYLDKYDAPLGKRTPNGFVWGHSIDDLFMIQRIPNVNVVTCWSRSMIKEYGELPIEDEDEPAPRIRRPYPLLKIDKDVECPESSVYSYFDEGSEHDDPIPVEDPEDKKPKEETREDMGVDSDSPLLRPRRDYIYQGNDGHFHRSLEEHIPQQFIPDRLIVTDPFGLAFGEGKRKDKKREPEPWIYERLYPSFPQDSSADRFSKDPVTAELYLDADRSQLVGIGNHSNVYRATLTLPKGLSARTPDGKVTVVAKTSFPDPGDRALFDNEAKIFDSFPRHLSEEWCGYNMVSPLSWPVPVGPVVPKFYGYYMPIGEKKDELSPIMLMEECGTPVKPGNLTPEQR